MSFEKLRQNLRANATSAIDSAEETADGKHPDIIARLRTHVESFCDELNSSKPIPVKSESAMSDILNNATDKTVGNIYIYEGEESSVYTVGSLYILEEVEE